MIDTDHISDPNPLLSVIERFAGLNIWVVGDIMLDEYVLGAVDRISPEAPVPVVRVRDTELRLGGAANVARQVAALGGKVKLAGVIGADGAGDNLLRLCAECGIDTSAILRLAERCTTRKLRVLGHNQQLLRLDWEDARPCTALATDALVAKLAATGIADAIILSDYAKGVLTLETIAAVTARRGAAPVVVDPKTRDFTRYRGATTVTPNLKELELATGLSLDPTNKTAIATAARPLIAAAGLSSMVVTLSEHGMLIVPADAVETAVSASRREVFDVTGAGDTAIAVLTLALAAKAPLVIAAQIANAAAGVSVGQVGAVAVDADSIRNELTAAPDAKVLAREELATRAASWRLAGKRIVFTNGCYDLLHAGHLSLLHSAARLGDVLVLAINSDASVKRLKGPERPLVTETERAALLAALACVDAVTIFDEDTPLEALKSVKPHVLVKGADYRVEQVVGKEFVESYGGKVALVPLLPAKSTSALVERIRGSASHRPAT
jgi:D-beta-D-heptose 7-phosphate kinase/D-beta-D-heptose 1-phosphate adenosyltransferase